MSHTTNGSGRAPVSDDRRPTMHDVADLAGVSLKTVSRVFNHEPNVRPAVRARVESAAVSLGFRRNIIAKNLRTGSATSTVGLVIADLLNPFYGAIATAVEAVANRHAATMILGSSAEDVVREQRIVTDLLEGPRRRPHRGPDRRRPQLSRTAAPARRPRRVRRQAGKRHRGRRGRPRQRRRGAIGDPPSAGSRPSPDRRSSATRRSWRRRRSGWPAIGWPSTRPGSSSIRRSSGSVRRGPSWPRSSPGSCSRATIRRPRSSPRTTASCIGVIRAVERHRPTGRRGRLRRLRAGRPARVTRDGGRLRPGRARTGRRRAPVRQDGRRPPAAPADRHPDPAHRPRLGRAASGPDRPTLTGLRRRRPPDQSGCGRSPRSTARRSRAAISCRA